MESLKADYIEVWAASQNLPLARFAHRTRSIASTGLDMLEFSPSEKLVAELRSFDSIVSWYGANRAEFRNAVHNLPVQISSGDSAAACAHSCLPITSPPRSAVRSPPSLASTAHEATVTSQ